MSLHTFEPEIEEEDNGYSIPKILVAVLLLVVIGAGIYIYLQQKKLTTSVSYLINAKKQVETDLNAMIEKYNLAIEDNDFLADELRDERDKIIQFRDSIKNVKGEDFGRITKYEQQIKSLKKNSAIVFEESFIKPETNNSIAEENVTDIKDSKTTDNIIPKKETTKQETIVKSKEVITETPPKALKNDIASSEKNVVSTEKNTPINNKINNSELTSVEKETKKTEEKKQVNEEKTKPSTTEITTSFVRVEIPPTYPGCKGDATQKKICFAKKVKSFVSKKFDGSIIDNLRIDSGKKRIWVKFNIDKFGNITNVNANAPKGLDSKASVALKEEAERVVKKLPKMVAARQNGNPVKMVYNVPITVVVP